MPSYIFMTPLASTYLNQFSAQPHAGQIRVPVIQEHSIELYPHQIQSAPLAAAVEKSGEGFVTELKEHLQLLKWTGKSVSVVSSVMNGDSRWRAIIGASGCLPASFVLNRREAASSDRSRQMTVVSLRGEDSRSLEPDRCLEIGIDHHSELMKARMKQALIRRKAGVSVTLPEYFLHFDSLSISGLRILLDLQETATMFEVGETLFRRLGLGRPREILTPRPTAFTGDLAAPSSFRITGEGIHRDIIIEGDLDFQNSEGTMKTPEEWLRLEILPQSRQHAALMHSEMELWDLPNSDLYPAAPSASDLEAYRQLTRRIYLQS